MQTENSFNNLPSIYIWKNNMHGPPMRQSGREQTFHCQIGQETSAAVRLSILRRVLLNSLAQMLGMKSVSRINPTTPACHPGLDSFSDLRPKSIRKHDQQPSGMPRKALVNLPDLVGVPQSHKNLASGSQNICFGASHHIPSCTQ